MDVLLHFPGSSFGVSHVPFLPDRIIMDSYEISMFFGFMKTSKSAINLRTMTIH